MSELSDKEVEKLLQKVDQAESDKPQPKKKAVSQPDFTRFDFNQPAQLGREHYRLLNRIHEQCCRDSAGQFSVKLGSPVELAIDSIERLTYGDVAQDLPNPSILYMFDFDELEGNLLIHMNVSLGFLLYERLAGGGGASSFTDRELTEIEENVVRHQVIEILADNLRESWSDLAELGLRLTAMESNPLFLQPMADRDSVVKIDLRFELDDSVETIRLIFSDNALAPILKGKRGSSLGTDKDKVFSEGARRIRRQISSSRVPVEVELGRTSMTVKELLNLEPGDVVALRRRLDQPLKVRIGGSPKFLAKPGRIGDRLGVVITARVDQNPVSRKPD